MTRKYLRAAAVALTGLMLALPMAASASDHSRRLDAATIDRARAAAEAAGYRGISEIETSRDRIKVEAFSADGKRVHLLLDPSTMAVLETRTRKS